LQPAPCRGHCFATRREVLGPLGTLMTHRPWLAGGCQSWVLIPNTCTVLRS
jgi:hypothetical protein